MTSCCFQFPSHALKPAGATESATGSARHNAEGVDLRPLGEDGMGVGGEWAQGSPDHIEALILAVQLARWIGV